MPTKKPATKPAPNKAAKPAAKKTTKPVAKPKARTVVKKKAAAQSHQSFRVSQPTNKFFTFKVTDQTVYWAVLMVFVLAFGAWTIRQEIEIQKIYDSIETNEASIDQLDEKSVQILKSKQQAQ